MTDLVTLYIDDQLVSVPKGMVVVDAAKKMGTDIPVFCYHPKLEPVGMCRMCLVEIGRPKLDPATKQVVVGPDGQPEIAWGAKLETGCTTPVSEGMRVRTKSDKAMAAQRDVLEFLLTSHPLDCPICDKGGECPLQNLTLDYGPGVSRFDFAGKQRLDKHSPLGDLIFLDKERCIQCARCIRFQEEIADDRVIGFNERGRTLEIATLSEPGFYSKFSGNTTDICPVGALTTSDFRFRARPWEMTNVPSICPHCAVGCNVTLGTRRSNARGGRWDILRVMPRQNEEVNEIWICDKGRFGHHYARSEERLVKPLIRKDGRLFVASWDEALALVATRLKAAGSNAGALIGDRLANEDVCLIRKLFGEGLQSVRINARPHVAAHEIATHYGVGAGSDFGKMGKGSAILVIAGDVEEEAPIWFLRIRGAVKRGAQLIVAHGYETKLDRSARLALRYKLGAEPYVAFGILNGLLSENRGEGVEGFAEVKGRAAEYTPEKVEQLTGVAAPAIREAAQIIAEATDVVIIFGQMALNLVKTGGETRSVPQASALAQACANIAVATGRFGRPNNGLLPLWPHNNTQGTHDLIGDLRFGAEPMPEVLYMVGTDPVGEEHMPRRRGDDGPFRIVQELFLTQTAQDADVVLPALSFAERDGTTTSADRRVQRFYRALPGLGDGKADWEIAQDIAWRLDLRWDYHTAEEVFAEIASAHPRYAGLSYAALAQSAAQWPPVGEKDLYFGGTAYDNRGGLGAQTKSGVELDGRASLAWIDAPARPDGFLVVPSRRLYARGTLIDQSEPFQPRLLNATLELHADDAAELGILDGDAVAVAVDGREAWMTARVDGRAPQGVALAPAGVPGGAAQVRKGA
ncbi:MAG TPA: NADH-quinone oxidoreductase subunit NuoG [Anaerolineae bacterium]|nr:NADH-quinone oxidoreductase subunit NuoG [Anaerolineae bacterium]